MKAIALKYKMFLGLGLVVLAALLCSHGLLGRIWNTLVERPKDASLIVANDHDQTMIPVYLEFKKFDAAGYRPGEYPALDELYCSRENWRCKRLEEFSTGMKMLSYGADRDLNRGQWDTVIVLLDEAIAGYRQFIPVRQETSAILYLQPCLHLAKRISGMQTSAIPRDIRQRMLVRLKRLEEWVKAASEESTNTIKKRFLFELNEVIGNLESRREPV